MSTKGLKRYTNGVENKMFLPGTQPDGWYQGVSDSYKLANRLSHIGQHSLYDGKSEQEIESIKSKISNARKNYFSNDENRKKQSDLMKRKYAEDDFRQMHLNAVQSESTKRKISESGKKVWESYSEDERQNRISSIRQGWINNNSSEKVSEKFKRYWMSEEYKQKRYNSLKENNSFNSSNLEDEYYNYLQTIYNEEDIIRQYTDDRYPFNCDFYIPSEDLFIECNYHWTHGGKPFNPQDDDCRQTLLEWQEKSKTSKYYENAINTWTVRDVKKLQSLNQKNLNYIIVYDKDIVYSHQK